MLKITSALTAKSLLPAAEKLFALSAEKIRSLEKSWPPENGTPVITIKGRYTSRDWTDWTQGFQFGSAILQYDATDEQKFLKLGRAQTIRHMAMHVSNLGVHDHGFNLISTYGNLRRLIREGRIPANGPELDFYELALKVSGAAQASRWTRLADGSGFIHSFNGPHSLFIDTIRSLRSLALAHQLGHALMGEEDERISLLHRLIEHAMNTSLYNVYSGDGRDAYDVRGRTAQEAVFNVASGTFRCPNSQQGYSPFSTWTRGLAWAICGFAEQLEFFRALDDVAIETEVLFRGKKPSREQARLMKRLRRSAEAAAMSPQEIHGWMLRTAQATADFYLANCCADGIPMWDTGAPNLHRLQADYLDRPSDPFNTFEPVDSSAAAIAAQGLLRLGNHLHALHEPRSGRREEAHTISRRGSQSLLTSAATVHDPNARRRAVEASQTVRHGNRYRQAAFTIAKNLFADPYLCANPKHQGLILHSVYHRPNGWDHVPGGHKIPCGESSLWGDYHARELALMILREAGGLPYYCFFDAD